MNPLLLIGLVLAGGAVYLLAGRSFDVRVLGQRLSDLSGVTPFLLAGSAMLFALSVLVSTNHNRVLRSGEPATATIAAMRGTGATVDGEPVFRFVLDVRRPDGPTRRATIKQAVPTGLAATLRPGTVVPVRVGARRFFRVAIDVGRAPPGATPGGA